MNDEQILEQARHIETIRQAEANVERAKDALDQAENTLDETKKSREKAATKAATGKK